jgi:putative ABC transport system permease protein
MERLAGVTTLNQIMVSATSAGQIDAVQSSLTQLLEQRHRIVPPQTDDFQVRNLQSIAQAASQTGAVMEFLLAGVAAVSLIVGGIGIMNIMMVSVTERTREIGLRMAVGARGKTILLQFLTESIVLATIGGFAGVGIGTIGTLVVSLLAHWPTSIPLAWLFASVAFAALVGIFFGYYPAQRASQLSPIEALRFE